MAKVGSGLALAVPSSTKNAEAAKDFVKWATSKDYVKLVATTGGISVAPRNEEVDLYRRVHEGCAFRAGDAQFEITADPKKPTVDPVPYTGISFVIIPPYQGIGTTTGQEIAGALAGQKTVAQALESA